MKRHYTTSLISVLIAATMIVPLSACGSRVKQEDQQQVQNTSSQEQTTQAGSANQQTSNESAVTSNETNTDSSSVNQEAEPPKPEVKKEQISLYYTDDEMLDLHEQKTEIEYSDSKQKLEAAFAAMKKDSDKGEPSLWKHAELLSVKQDGTAITLDLHLPDDARLGAPGEMLALDAIEKTYFQFQDVTSIDLLVDGESVDSLMGHMDLDHPITKQ
ncbi:sporulation and spore germination protein [Paenibacillus taihuensis]|uniref:Sporulation and spore germination protein n=1 Tax=Paenibacillus taihuensis TaxID=1156355 RepID=A0A3D9SCR8_9BACL|nr:GerMN domain-containing protein [Paenibacillus taihuensis]REE88599.1 sporulation and spore germination protein [Paenibacillus taihuensis]